MAALGDWRHLLALVLLNCQYISLKYITRLGKGRPQDERYRKPVLDIPDNLLEVLLGSEAITARNY